MNATWLNRRQLLAGLSAAGCSCLSGCVLPQVSRREQFLGAQAGEIVDERPYGRIEQLGSRTYALVSSPFDAHGGAGDRTTHSNGGLIAGNNGILAVDSFRRPEGAAWLADFSFKRFGQRPTHVVCTHFHFDHVGGLAGYFHDGHVPEILMSQTTAELAAASNNALVADREDARFASPAIRRWGGHVVGPTRVLTEGAGPIEIDLGGRSARIVPLRGHTDSDLVVEVDDPEVIFGGDLIWNGIFPNFMSSTPSHHLASVQTILEKPRRIVVPGHGPVGTAESEGLNQFGGLLSHIESHARRFHGQGVGVEEATRRFVVPASLGRWSYFRDGFHQTAMQAWYRELTG